MPALSPSAAGIEFEETAALIGLMGNAGIQGSEGGNGAPGGDRATPDSRHREAKSVMEELGLSSSPNANGRLRPIRPESSRNWSRTSTDTAGDDHAVRSRDSMRR